MLSALFLCVAVLVAVEVWAMYRADTTAERLSADIQQLSSRLAVLEAQLYQAQVDVASARGVTRDVSTRERETDRRLHRLEALIEARGGKP